MTTLTKTHKINVTVEGRTIRVDPDTLVMNTLDEVHWAGSNPRRFSIAFDGTGPFASRELSHETATSKQRPRNRGHFKYTVISADDPTVRLDPIIIVEDPPTEEKP